MGYEFVAETHYDKIGYCWFVTENFVTMVHTTPCTASIAESMDKHGWEIYVQPYKMYVTAVSRDRESYIVTYRKKRKSHEI